MLNEALVKQVIPELRTTTENASDLCSPIASELVLSVCGPVVPVEPNHDNLIPRTDEVPKDAVIKLIRMNA
jgi:hypothetical protein